MRNLISAELLKLRTTRAFWAYVASIVVFVPISIALSITVGNEQNPLTTSDGIRGVFSAASSGLLMAVLLGITMSAGEFRNNTATPTFLITPDRRRVMAAKVASRRHPRCGACSGLRCAHRCRRDAVAASSQRRRQPVERRCHPPIAGALLSLALGVIFGIGIGGLIPNQTIAITVHRRVVLDHRSVPHRLRARGRPLAADRRRQRARRNMDKRRGPTAVLGCCPRSHRLLRVRGRRRHAPHHPQGHDMSGHTAQVFCHPIAATLLPEPEPETDNQP